MAMGVRVRLEETLKDVQLFEKMDWVLYLLFSKEKREKEEAHPERRLSAIGRLFQPENVKLFSPDYIYVQPKHQSRTIECHRSATPIGKVMRATLLTHPNNTLLGSSWGAVMFRHVQSLDLVVGTKFFTAFTILLIHELIYLFMLGFFFWYIFFFEEYIFTCVDFICFYVIIAM